MKARMFVFRHCSPLSSSVPADCPRRSRLAPETLPAPAPIAAPVLEDSSGAWAPDRPEAGSVEKIREYTTAPEFLAESVAYVPDSDTVPSPTKVLGRIIGTPDELSRVADVHGYFRRLDEASDRVQVRVIGTSEEGREILLAVISDPENLADLDHYRDVTARLGDPRRTSREEARRLAADGKVLYWLTGGLHSTETGSPEMLMELAYRLAVSEKPEIQAIRKNAIVLITPVTEPDGRDRQVDWFYRHVRGKKMPWEELSDFDSPPYWGHYVLPRQQPRRHAGHPGAHPRHPRDVLRLAPAGDARPARVRPPALHLTGHGPYNRAIDPVTISEWTQFGHHEAGALAAQGLPGVWTWGFFDGWWPGYLNSVANTHHSVGRFYETFGNGSAGTFDRDLSEARFAGKPVTDVQWYRPWPPDKKVRWSLRNNTNYMEAGALAALEYAAVHRQELLENTWAKAERSLTKGKTRGPLRLGVPAGPARPGPPRPPGQPAAPAPRRGAAPDAGREARLQDLPGGHVRGAHGPAVPQPGGQSPGGAEVPGRRAEPPLRRRGLDVAAPLRRRRASRWRTRRSSTPSWSR